MAVRPERWLSSHWPEAEHRENKKKKVAQGVQAARTVSSSWQVHWYDTDLVAARAPVALRVGG